MFKIDFILESERCFNDVRYLFEPSVLDVELLGIDKVKQFAIFLPGERVKVSHELWASGT